MKVLTNTIIICGLGFVLTGCGGGGGSGSSGGPPGLSASPDPWPIIGGAGTLTITNTGGSTLYGLDFSVEGAVFGGELNSNCPFESPFGLNPGQSCTMSVTDAVILGSASITISGSGVSSIIVPITDGVSSPNTFTRTSAATGTLTIKNTTTSPQKLSFTGLANPSGSCTTLSNQTLAQGQMCQLNLSDAANQTYVFSVLFNGAVNATYKVSMPNTQITLGEQNNMPAMSIIASKQSPASVALPATQLSKQTPLSLYFDGQKYFYLNTGAALYQWTGDARGGFNQIGTLQGNNAYVDAIAGPVTANNGDTWLFFGGNFTGVDQTQAQNIVAYDLNSHAWINVGNANQTVNSLLAINAQNIVAGGSFTHIGAANTNNLALWNVNNAWSALGQSNFNGPVYALNYQAGTNTLYVGGAFTQATSQVSANNTAAYSWENGSWQALASGLSGPVLAINYPYFAGNFAGANGHYFAEYSNGAWTDLGNQVSGTMNSIAINPVSGEVYVGGQYQLSEQDLNTKNLAIYSPDEQGWETQAFSLPYNIENVISAPLITLEPIPSN